MEVELAHWLPSGVAASLLLMLGGFVLKLVAGRSKEVLDDVKAIRAELNLMDKKMGDFATSTQLGNMGNRFDDRHMKMLERIVNNERDLAVLKDQVHGRKRGRT